MTTTTLAILRASAADRADMPTPSTTTFIPTATWTKYINASIQALYDKLIEAYGEDYFLSESSDITTDGTNTQYTLSSYASTFYKLLGVDMQVNAGAGEAGWATLQRFNMSDRNKWGEMRWGLQLPRYRLAGSKIWFAPLPPANQVFRIWYAPTFTALVNDGDTFDGINGWEEWVVNDVAMKALAKEESDLSGVMALQQQVEARLATIINNRDAASPQTTADVYGQNALVDWPGWF